MQKVNLIQSITKILLLALACFGFADVQAQRKVNPPGEYIFTTYTAADGLASAEILSLAIDKKGFLWAGTVAGLSRYDGYTFTNFSWSADNHFIGVVNVIKNDTAGRVWVGASSGLYCWWQNKLLKISAEAKPLHGVNDIISEADGGLWLATENGPAFINAADIDVTGAKKITLQKFILQQWTERYDALYPSQCRLIKKAPDGAVYFSNQYQLFRIVAGRIDLVHSTRQENDKIEFIIPVSSTKVFYNAAMTGLNKVQDRIYTDLDFENLYQPDKKPVTEGIWYVGSLGIVCFHPEEEFISKHINFKDEGASWLSFIFKQNNIFWLATHNGLIKIKPSVFNLYAGDEFRNIDETFSFCELKDGKFLAGANHGEIYQVSEKGVDNFLPGGVKPVPNAEIKAMYQDERGWLWMGTGYQGLALYRNGKTKRFTEESNQLHDNSFSSFLATKKGKLFAIGDKGMSEIAVDEKGNISFKSFYSRPVHTSSSKFYGGIEAPDGTVWIAGEEGLRFLKDDSLVAYLLPLKNISIQSIKIDADGLVWIATAGNGIICCRFDEYSKLQVIKQYNEANGLNTLQFLDLFIDKEDNIWAGSVKGLTFIGRNGKHKERLVNFTEADGFIKPGYYSCKIYQDRQEKIWMGTSKGITSFVANGLFLSESATKIYLTGVELLKGTNKGMNSDSLIADNMQYNLALPYYSNAVSFKYTAVNFSAPEAIQYFYKLDGLDTNWIATGSRRNVAFYNLAAGKYIFNVKAVSEKGEWSKGETSFLFIIKPPFWQTWWFRVLAAIFICAFISLMVKKRISSIKRKAAVKQQMTELEIKALRAQMNPHFIFNAMNSIQQFTLKNDVDNANLYISKFSTLLRKVLHSSQQNFISLEEEREQLKLYLEIEKLRMGDDFSYSIKTDDEIEDDAVKIPGMLIQPFVENALKHGLAPRKGEKKLDIDFSITGDNKLTVVITDNGIGRKKAGELKMQNEKLLPHESKGIKLVQERMKLLNHHAAENIVAIEDLHDKDGGSAGTKVSLGIPLHNRSLMG